MDSNFSITTANLSQTFLLDDNKSGTMNYTYCNLKDFEISYRQIHGYLSIFVCVFGSITNVVNIVVLTSPAMRWPTNFILTGLAIADLMVMLVYIPFASHNYLDPEERYFARYFSYPWALYMYFQALFTQICHFISCCLTVMLAVWRYLAITEPLNSKIWCNPYRTKIGIFLTYALCPVVCLPLIFGLYVNTSEHLIYANDMLVPEGQVPTYNLSQNLTAIINVLAIDEEYRTFNFWVYSVVIKFVPSVLLTVLSVMLIWALLEAKRRSERLNNNSANDGKAKVEAANTTRESSIALLVTKTATKTQRNAEKEQQAIRTNRMLLAVLLLFLMTEFPQAILGLLSVILGNQFQMQCYFRLGDVFDMVALTNSAINFILYCSMSSQFRAAFKAIHLHPIFLTKWKSVSSQITEVHQPSEVQVTQL